MLAAEARSNFRLELFATLPVTPRVVYLFRLTAALTVSVTVALLVNAIQGAFSRGDGTFTSATLSWLGPGLLAASCAAVTGARWSAAAGQAVGLVVWIGTTLLRLPAGPVDTGLGQLHSGAVLSGPLTLVLAGVLFAFAVSSVPGRGTISTPRVNL